MRTTPHIVRALQPIVDRLWHAKAALATFAGGVFESLGGDPGPVHEASQRRALRRAADGAAGVSGV